MAIPDYFKRNAVAISQATSGLDEQRLESVLGGVCIGVTVGPDASGHEGRAIVDLLVRLLARLYPSIVILDEGDGGVADEVSTLAGRINPRIELSGQPTVEVVIGSAEVQQGASRTVFVGSSGWSAKLSTRNPQGCGNTNNPYGAGLAACLAAADLFRSVFLTGAESNGDFEFAFPTLTKGTNDVGDISGNVGSLVLAGAGAIGNAAAWALSRTDVNGSIEIVDHESVDLGNLQRYVLAERDDENKPKAKLVAGTFAGTLSAKAQECKLAEFLQKKRHKVDNLLLALDSAKDRRAAQTSLPRRITNAWTQPDDLGVSTHDFLEGACVSCLYLPEGKQRNEDEIIAEALGVSEKLMDVRVLLHRNEGTPRNLLEAIATAQNIPLEKLMAFEGHPLRQLYTDGFCGGAVIPLDMIGAPANDVHVPLAHQSAMAGVLLAGTGVQLGLGASGGSVVAQYNVLKPQARFHLHPVAKKVGGKCICQDKDYIDVYRKKYGLDGD